MSFADYQNYLRILRYWNLEEGHVDSSTGIHISCQEFRRSENHSWYQNIQVFKINKITNIDGSETEVLERIDRNTQKWKRVVHRENIFDAIHECHVQEKHHKIETTKRLADEKYWNITRESCHNFILTCPDCIMKKQRNKTPQSTKIVAQVPSFFDRFETTIIDFRHNPKPDAYGNTMSHVLLVVDKLSDWVVLRPLAEVDKRSLEAEILTILCTRGYPRRINHASLLTSVSNVASRALDRQHQDYITQCKSENNAMLDAHEKRFIGVIQNLEQVGKPNSNWVDLLNTATIVMNSTRKKSRNQKLKDPPKTDDHSDRSCENKTASNKKPAQSPAILSAQDTSATRMFDDTICSNIIDTTRTNQQSTFLSIDFSQEDQNTESNDNDATKSMQDMDLMKLQAVDVCDVATVAKNLFRPEALDMRHYFRTETSSAQDNLLHMDDDEVIPYYPPNEVEQFDTGKRRRELYNKFNVLEAFNAGYTTTRIVDKIEYRLCHPVLDCEICDENYCSQPITIAEDPYYDLYHQAGRWFSCDMVLTFGRLCSHDAHRQDVIYVDAMMPDKVNDGTRTKNTALPETVQTIVSVVFEENHFAIMRMCLAEQKTYIYDGLSMPHQKWTRQMEYILDRYGIGHHDWTLTPGKGKDGMDGITIKQKDQSNCGPIACMVLWKLFKGDQMNLRLIQSSKYRQHALTELSRLITTHENCCVIYKRKKRIPGVIGFIDITEASSNPTSSTVFDTEKSHIHESKKQHSEPITDPFETTIIHKNTNEQTKKEPYVAYIDHEKKPNESLLNDFITKTPIRHGKKHTQKNTKASPRSDDENTSFDMDEETSVEKALLREHKTRINRSPAPHNDIDDTSEKSWRSSPSIILPRGQTVPFISGLSESDSEDRSFMESVTKSKTTNDGTIIEKRKAVRSSDNRHKKPRINVGIANIIRKKKNKCNCKKDCNSRCGCIRSGQRCNLDCSCKGRCNNK
jgi:hypothetical protein